MADGQTDRQRLMDSVEVQVTVTGLDSDAREWTATEVSVVRAKLREVTKQVTARHQQLRAERRAGRMERAQAALTRAQERLAKLEAEEAEADDA